MAAPVSILVAMLTSDGVAVYRTRIEEDVATALDVFAGERFAALRDRIRAEAGALRLSLLAAELELPREQWSGELKAALVEGDKLLLLAAEEMGIEVS